MTSMNWLEGAKVGDYFQWLDFNGLPEDICCIDYFKDNGVQVHFTYVTGPKKGSNGYTLLPQKIRQVWKHGDGFLTIKPRTFGINSLSAVGENKTEKLMERIVDKRAELGDRLKALDAVIEEMLTCVKSDCLPNKHLCKRYGEEDAAK